MYQVTVTANNDSLEIKIPSSYLKSIGFPITDKLFLTREGGRLVLSKTPPVTIEDLLKGSSKEDFVLTDDGLD